MECTDCKQCCYYDTCLKRLGWLSPVDKTSEMTQDVGFADGQLYTKPGATIPSLYQHCVEIQFGDYYGVHFMLYNTSATALTNLVLIKNAMGSAAYQASGWYHRESTAEAHAISAVQVYNTFLLASAFDGSGDDSYSITEGLISDSVKQIF